MKAVISLILWLSGGLFFLFSFILIVITLFILPREIAYKLIRFLFAITLKLIGVRLKVTGKDNVDPKHRYLIMANHQSLFDIFVVPVAVRVRFVGIEAAEHFNYPVWGWFVRKWGNIPIERGDKEKAIKSLQNAAQVLKTTSSIAVLPEGHRTRTGEIGPFKKGPFHLAMESETDILPMSIRGLYEFKQKGSWLLKPGRVYANIGEPVPFDEYKDMSVEELSDFMRENIDQLFTEEFH